jgi:hypothetical protein
LPDIRALPNRGCQQTGIVLCLVESNSGSGKQEGKTSRTRERHSHDEFAFMAPSEGTPSANFSVALLAFWTRVLAIVFELSEPMAPISRHATHPFDRVGERLLAFAIATAAFHADVAVPHHKSGAALGRLPGPLFGQCCGPRLLVLRTQRRVASHGGHTIVGRRPKLAASSCDLILDQMSPPSVHLSSCALGAEDGLACDARATGALASSATR